MNITPAEAQAKKENAQNTFLRQPHKWVPCSPKIGVAIIAYGGKNYFDVQDDFELLTNVVDNVLEKIPVDIICGNSISINPDREKIMDGHVQTTLHSDGITLEHRQVMHMTGDDYPALIADPDGFVENVLLPRKLPFIFEEGLEKAAKRFEALLMSSYNQKFHAPAKLLPYVMEKYAPLNMGGGAGRCSTPGDVIMDAYRGFKGTMTDLRRHYSEMKELADVIWEKNMVDHMTGYTYKDFHYPSYMTHIPCFLNPKQYDDLCFKYFKQQIENMYAGGGKLYMLSEGNWKNVIHFMNDLPQDSVIFNCEDDDICEAYDTIGAKQIIMGGCKIVTTRLDTAEACKDMTKRAIDHCAPGNAFIYATDKAWCCKGDCNDNLIEAFAFAGEYGKY